MRESVCENPNPFSSNNPCIVRCGLTYNRTNNHIRRINEYKSRKFKQILRENERVLVIQIYVRINYPLARISSAVIKPFLLVRRVKGILTILHTTRSDDQEEKGGFKLQRDILLHS